MINKKEFINMLSKKTGKTKKEILESTDMVLDGIVDAYKYYGGVKFVDFGIFKIKETKERNGTDPNTLKPIIIPAKKVPKFEPSSTLKEIFV